MRWLAQSCSDGKRWHWDQTKAHPTQSSIFSFSNPSPGKCSEEGFFLSPVAWGCLSPRVSRPPLLLLPQPRCCFFPAGWQKAQSWNLMLWSLWTSRSWKGAMPKGWNHGLCCLPLIPTGSLTAVLMLGEDEEHRRVRQGPLFSMKIHWTPTPCSNGFHGQETCFCNRLLPSCAQLPLPSLLS